MLMFEDDLYDEQLQHQDKSGQPEDKETKEVIIKCIAGKGKVQKDHQILATQTVLSKLKMKVTMEE